MPDGITYRAMAYSACVFCLLGHHTGEEVRLALAVLFALAGLIVALAAWARGR